MGNPSGWSFTIQLPTQCWNPVGQNKTTPIPNSNNAELQALLEGLISITPPDIINRMTLKEFTFTPTLGEPVDFLHGLSIPEQHLLCARLAPIVIIACPGIVLEWKPRENSKSKNKAQKMQPKAGRSLQLASWKTKQSKKKQKKAIEKACPGSLLQVSRFFGLADLFSPQDRFLSPPEEQLKQVLWCFCGNGLRSLSQVGCVRRVRDAILPEYGKNRYRITGA